MPCSDLLSLISYANYSKTELDYGFCLLCICSAIRRTGIYTDLMYAFLAASCYFLNYSEFIASFLYSSSTYYNFLLLSTINADFYYLYLSLFLYILNNFYFQYSYFFISPHTLIFLFLLLFFCKSA